MEWKIGDRFYYLFMNGLCKSYIKDIIVNENGRIFYVDGIFNNIDPKYMFKNPDDCINFHKKKYSN